MGDSVGQEINKNQTEKHHEQKCNKLFTAYSNKSKPTYETRMKTKKENSSKMRQVFVWLKGIDASVKIDDTLLFTVIFV